MGMQKEAQKYVKKCDQYQRFALNIHQPGGCPQSFVQSVAFYLMGLGYCWALP